MEHSVKSMEKEQKRNWKNSIVWMSLGVLLLVLFPFCAQASELPDWSKSGSVSVSLRDASTGEICTGGELLLYRVADPVSSGETYVYQLTDAFAESQLSLEDIASDTLANQLAAYVGTQDLSAEVQTVDAEGSVCFSGLETGLYLIVQQEESDASYTVEPFLVSVPLFADGTWVYDVDAAPKAEVTADTSGKTDDSDPGTDDPNLKTDDSDSKISDANEGTSAEKLPQTGQLNWPIPVLAMAGLLLFVYGWRQRRLDV